MINLILGDSGSGKTKMLIDLANEEKSRGNGNIVFIDSDDSHIYSLDYAVRLINARDFDINCPHCLYGFIAGIVSRDYDIEKMYLDGLYELVEFDDESLNKFLSKLDKLSKSNEIDFYIGLEKLDIEVPEELDILVKEI